MQAPPPGPPTGLTGPRPGPRGGGRSPGVASGARRARARAAAAATGPQAATATAALSRPRPHRPPPSPAHWLRLARSRLRGSAAAAPLYALSFPRSPSPAFVCPPVPHRPLGPAFVGLRTSAAPSARPDGGRDRSRRAPHRMPRGGDKFRLRRRGSQDKWCFWRGPCGRKGEPRCAWAFRCLSFPRLALAGAGLTAPRSPPGARWALQPDRPRGGGPGGHPASAPGPHAPSGRRVLSPPGAASARPHSRRRTTAAAVGHAVPPRRPRGFKARPGPPRGGGRGPALSGARSPRGRPALGVWRDHHPSAPSPTTP